MMSIPSYCHGERAERFLHDNVVADDQDHIGEHWVVLAKAEMQLSYSIKRGLRFIYANHHIAIIYWLHVILR